MGFIETFPDNLILRSSDHLPVLIDFEVLNK